MRFRRNDFNRCGIRFFSRNVRIGNVSIGYGHSGAKVTVMFENVEKSAIARDDLETAKTFFAVTD